MILVHVLKLLKNANKSCILDVFADPIMLLTCLYKYFVGTIIYSLSLYQYSKIH